VTNYDSLFAWAKPEFYQRERVFGMYQPLPNYAGKMFQPQPQFKPAAAAAAPIKHTRFFFFFFCFFFAHFVDNNKLILLKSDPMVTGTSVVGLKYKGNHFRLLLIGFCLRLWVMYTVPR
jgi:hypothetical protein